MSSASSKDQQTVSLEARLSRLDEVERKIMLIMQHAGNALDELSKDRPTVKQVENHTHNFRVVLKEVETEMNAHISYLNQISAGLPYEGTTYAEAIDLYQAVDRLLLVKSKLYSLL
ncbi:Mediator of RNA polymerase II transcription subunit 11 [Clonorchis sinensis]|uniref:Mediator of RNA polymerase II transcription subunit 11 n=2 Tax=Clonorchis sinensis TaxID=79923 RepID=G7YPI9_CLOSI|nr:Mediator of RNA polymerase II transcription subunit 11 [Clonorchis sinensis]GAA54870.1 mediator of RNA polymerase II transcription subunit 11 [Clonorchis sinensis]